MSSAFRWSATPTSCDSSTRVVGGTGIEEFTDTTLAGDQFALF